MLAVTVSREMRIIIGGNLPNFSSGITPQPLTGHFLMVLGYVSGFILLRGVTLCLCS